MEYGKRGGGGEVAKQPVKQVEPDFKPSGALAAETKCVPSSKPFVSRRVS